jgi:8-amino-7-oxononanoate synthase
MSYLAKMDNWDDIYKNYNNTIAQENKRTLKTDHCLQYTNSNNIINFCSNDYLGINSIPEIKHKIQTHISEKLLNNTIDIGASGSRLLSGNTNIHIQLEALIASTKGFEACLTFNSGYQINSNILYTLLQNFDKNNILVFSDKNNHASMHHAFNLLQIKQIRYDHSNLEHLKSRLKYYTNINPSASICIATESVFSMDGDSSNMLELVDIAHQYNALLYIDEAHATGIIGYGLSCGLTKKYANIVAMGTFSKALGASGGYVVCSKHIQEYLVNKCAGFIYSTAPSPLIMHAVYYVWENLHTDYFIGLRKHVQNLAEYLRINLLKNGFNIGYSNTNIVPIIFDSIQKSNAAYEKLKQNKVIVSHIRPPTVTKNSPRLRVSLCANHTIADINQLLSVLS